MINAKSLSPFDLIFSHTDDDGTTTHIAVGRLNEWCKVELSKGKIEVFKVPIDVEFAEWCVSNHGIEPHRLARMVEHLSVLDTEPVIFVAWPNGSHLLADGNHRYVSAARAGHTEINAFVLTDTEWWPFQIKGLPHLSMDLVQSGRSGIG
jgi:hypothetical protein